MSSLRVLTLELAARSDASLRRLFAARPDLVRPPVPDFAALAARVCTRASLGRALDRLDLPQLQVAEALLLTADEDAGRPATAAQLKRAIPGCTAGALTPILAELERQALAYRVPSAAGAPKSASYYPVGALREVIGAHPGGLGRSYPELVRAVAAAGPALMEASTRLRAAGYPVRPAGNGTEAALALEDWLAAPEVLPELLASSPESTTALLAKLAAHPLGSVPKARRALPDLMTATTAVDWLLAHGLIVAIGEETVELPATVGLLLRGGAVITEFAPRPAVPAMAQVPAAVVRNAALSAASELLRNLAAALDAVRAGPLATLRTGGVGIREVRRITEAVGCAPELTPFLLELAAAAGLVVLNVDTSRWEAAGPAVTAWLAHPRQQQWLQLTGAWLEADRVPDLVGSPAPRGSGAAGAGAINVLAAEAHRADAPELRRAVLAAVLELHDAVAAAGAAGAAPTAGQVLERVRWHRPRLVRRLRRLLPGFLREAALLGILGSGALSPAGVPWCAGDAEGAALLLAAELPAPVDHVLLQADLTAVAPGYLDPDLGRELRLLADAEGQGPAAVYRFSSAGIRRALDAGRSGDGILRFLAEHSVTPVPQPLEYLVRDTDARHGALRAGTAGSYLVARDPDSLAALLELPALVPLGLRLLAPTVLVSTAAAGELTAALAELGLHPAAEVRAEPGPQAAAALRAADGAGGATAVARSRTGPGGTGPDGGTVAAASPAWPVPGRVPEPTAPEDIAAQLAALRAKPSWVPAGAEAGTQLGLEALQRAIRLKVAVRITLVDGSGNAERLELVPLSLSGGRVRVFDPQRSTERVVSIHRVMEVEPL
ncbi:MAG: helicase-associated domain-containing protein [Actinomycetales bacterium]